MAAACMDDFVTSLSPKVKKWFSNLGSEEIDSVKYRCGYAFVGVQGKMQPYENSGKETKDLVKLT